MGGTSPTVAPGYLGPTSCNIDAVMRGLDPSVRDFVRKRTAERCDSEVRTRRTLDDFDRRIDEQNAQLCKLTSVCVQPICGR